MNINRTLSGSVSQKVGSKVKMSGWAQTIRDHSKVRFIDLRDREGITQLVITSPLLEKFKEITPESVITITGQVVERPKSLINAAIISGEVEVQVEAITVDSLADILPIPINDDTVSEELRLKYRYLDLRSKRMSSNIKTRHKINNYIRQLLDKKDFVEVETPYISKSTPEGARDFLIPSRIMPGNFYALPQSPQQYKQLLMVAGIERYYQITRCFRDEDARGDRQPEFTQLDLELSFTTKEEVLELVEELVLSVVKKYFPEKILTNPTIPIFTYKQAIEQYGIDKPDIRHDKTNSNELAFAFVVDFPLFEWKEQENRYDSIHHPFTSPKEEYEKNFDKHPKDALALQYDLVLNGYEIAGGSIRIHKADILEKVFRFLGHSKDKIRADFGHMLDAFSFGVPPHGGIAIGLDRFYAILLSENTIRDVIPFAKSGDGRDFMMNSPAKVDESQLNELGLKIKK